MATAQSVCGNYVGQKRVREGRQDELIPTERKQLERGQGRTELRLLPDGEFQHEITHGQWKMAGDRIVCTPTTFGGQTRAEMQNRAEQMGRTFALGFLFRPFTLRLVGSTLVTTDDDALIYTEFTPVRQ
jgi:hypothetical protein